MEISFAISYLQIDVTQERKIRCACRDISVARASPNVPLREGAAVNKMIVHWNMRSRKDISGLFGILLGYGTNMTARIGKYDSALQTAAYSDRENQTLIITNLWEPTTESLVVEKRL